MPNEKRYALIALHARFPSLRPTTGRLLNLLNYDRNPHDLTINQVMGRLN